MKIDINRRDYRSMIKNIKVSFAALLIGGIFSTPSIAQHKVCVQDTVSIYAEQYRGQISWQNSVNGIDWTYINGAQGDSISLIANDPLFIRIEIIEGDCMPLYSDVMTIELFDSPIVEFVSREPLCINERDFLLTGGSPEGGHYFGPGVKDGYFNPADAGAGTHTLGYFFRDSLTGCADSSFTQIEVFPMTSDSHAGADLVSIMSDTVQLQANVPDFGVGTWSIISEGSTGSFSDINNPKAWFRKDSAQLDYTLRWTIEGNCGTDFDDLSLNFMDLSINPCPGVPILVDADGNTYKTIQINNQCWMAENLRTGVYVPSTTSTVDHSDLKNNGITEKYCFENDEANCELYGGLYDWHEAMNYSAEEGAQGICPDGWHIPTKQDWADLDAQFKYGDAGEHLKDTGDSGFNGQFAGDRHIRGAFYSFGSSGFWWSSESYIYRDYNEGYFRKIAACNGWLEKDHFDKTIGLSVRCIKDNE